MSEGEVKKVGEKKTGPKEVSFFAMIFSGIWIIVLSLIKAFWGVIVIYVIKLEDVSFGLTIGEIIFSGVVIGGVFTPIYFSIIMDKIKEIKLGG